MSKIKRAWVSPTMLLLWMSWCWWDQWSEKSLFPCNVVGDPHQWVLEQGQCLIRKACSIKLLQKLLISLSLPLPCALCSCIFHCSKPANTYTMTQDLGKSLIIDTHCDLFYKIWKNPLIPPRYLPKIWDI